MNVLFIFNVMFHPQRGGTERVTDLLCREFLRRGHHVFYLNYIRDENRMDYSYPAPYYFFPFPIQEIEGNGKFLCSFLQEHHIDFMIDQDPNANFNLYPFIKNIQEVRVISVIHYAPLLMYHHLGRFIMWKNAHDKSVGAIRKIARILTIPKYKHRYWRTLKANYEKILLYSDAFCLFSPKYISDLKQIYSKNLERVVAIPNPNTFPVLQNIDFPKKKQILYVARLEFYLKRADRLIPIWERLYRDFPDWELVIVGDGTLKEEMERKASKMERVVFTGWQDSKPFYRDASILCLTSDSEGWAMVLAEAMAWGTIPVAFNSFASATDIIDDGQTGMLVPPFSQKKFAKKLSILMKDEALRREMSLKCTSSVKRFDIQKVGNQWEKLFHDLTV